MLFSNVVTRDIHGFNNCVKKHSSEKKQNEKQKWL